MSGVKHRPELDGVRGIAILLVMLAHAGVPGFRSGGVAGVTLFFVLSGFLITTLLVEERERTGRVSLCAFYRRRALRLLPALAALIAVGTAYQLVAVGPGFLPSVLIPLFYVGNFVRQAGHDFWPFGHTWSLAIEEQFYLVWPLALIVLRSRRALLIVAVTGAALSAAANVLLWHGPGSADRVYYGTDTRADALMLGCVLALAGVRFGRPALLAAIACLVPATVATAPHTEFVVAPLLAAAGAALLIASAPRALGWAPLRLTGRISYGLYLWNVPIAGVLEHRLTGVPLAVAMIAATYGLAAISYRWIESPFLRRKRSENPVERDRAAGDEVSGRGEDGYAGDSGRGRPRTEEVFFDDVRGGVLIPAATDS